MRTWLAQHWSALALVAGRMVRAPLASLLTVIVGGAALSLPAGLYLLVQNAEMLAAAVPAKPQISLFLALDAKQDTANRIKAELGRYSGVKGFRFVPRDQALRELQQGAGLDDMMKGLERNPLPDAFVVEPAGTDPDALERMRADFARWPGVEHVQLDSAWARRLHALLALGRQAALILTVLLGFALAVIIGNTIRLQILTQREEIEVSKLIGASDPFIRRPFLYYGALHGLIGGLAAWAIVGISILLLNQNVVELSRLYASDFRLHGISLGDSMGLLAFSSALGWAGAFLAVGRYLRRIDPR